MFHSSTFATIVELGDGNSAAARPSSDELVAILEHLGAVVVTRAEHGVFLRAERRLVFVRSRGVVDDRELDDVLRGAGLSADRFAVLLANSRRLSA